MEKKEEVKPAEEPLIRRSMPELGSPQGAESRPNLSMKKRTGIGIFEIALAIVLSVAIIAYSYQISEYFGQFSYIGIFFISLIAHATVFFPTAPFQFAMISLAVNLDPILFGIVAGVGSAIGELTGYAVGLGSQNLLKNQNKIGKWIIKLQQNIMRWQPGIAIFVLSAVPNPFFDFAGIVAGMAKMKWQYFVIWCAAGRILRYALIAYFGLWVASRYF